VIRGGEIIGAGVTLPLTQYPPKDRPLGTRHRAALGLSEETDAYVVVVSEETGQISLARRGVLRQGLQPEQLRARLATEEDTADGPVTVAASSEPEAMLSAAIPGEDGVRQSV